MNKQTRKQMLESYTRDLLRTYPEGTTVENNASVKFYVKRYKKLLKGD